MKNLKTVFAVASMAVAMFTACTSGEQKVLTVSGLDPAKFDTIINEKPVKLYTLKNANGMEVCITNYGARIVSMMVPDKNDSLVDVVLGFDNIAQYMEKTPTTVQALAAMPTASTWVVSSSMATPSS